MSEQLVTPENVTTKDGKINLLDLNRQQMREFFKDLGEKPFRADQVMKWMYHYCCDNFDEMTDINKVLRGKLKEVARLNAEKQALYRKAREKAEALTQSRLGAFAALEQQLVEACTFLNMPGVRFTLQHSRGPLAGSGQDTLEFYISPNPGEAPKPLAKIASGGELSRIMLALKSALAEKDSIGTVIYDEIDTGVSGSAAGRIGQKLKQTSRGRQVICITHTAQIAAQADRHLLIRKNVEEERTYTRLYPLDGEGRVEELARIISGDQITPIALANAREMLGL